MTDAPALSLLQHSEAEDGTSIIHVFAKRTYTFMPNCPLTVAPDQVPIRTEPAYYEAAGQGTETAPSSDPDLFCHMKFGTDIIVQGTAYAPHGATQSMDIAVALRTENTVERLLHTVRVTGDRRVEFRGHENQVTFTPPEPFERMPVTYARAYGGCDLWSPSEHPDEIGDWLSKFSEASSSELSLYRYPRNPSGRGYVVHPSRAAFEALLLPNLELPGDLLTPVRLCTGDLYRWPTAPFPAGFEWYDPSWFPRIAFIGGGCLPHRCAPEDFIEVRGGMLPADLVAPTHPDAGLDAWPRLDPRFFHGASPPLLVPTLDGRETIVLWGMHPTSPRLDLTLPAEEPQVLIELRNGRVVELPASLRTITIRPDDALLIAVWTARQPLSESLGDEEFAKMRHAVRWRATRS